MVTEVRVNMDSDNCLLPAGTKPFPEPILTYQSSVRFNNIHLGAILQEMPKPSITEIGLKLLIFILIFHPNPGPISWWFQDFHWSDNIILNTPWGFARSYKFQELTSADQPANLATSPYKVPANYMFWSLFLQIALKFIAVLQIEVSDYNP